MGLREDVLLDRIHAQLREQLLDHGVGCAQAFGPNAIANRRSVLALDLAGDVAVEPLALANLPLEVQLGLTELLDLRVREIECFEEFVLGNLVRSRLDHR